MTNPTFSGCVRVCPTQCPTGSRTTVSIAPYRGARHSVVASGEGASGERDRVRVGRALGASVRARNAETRSRRFCAHRCMPIVSQLDACSTRSERRPVALGSHSRASRARCSQIRPNRRDFMPVYAFGFQHGESPALRRDDSARNFENSAQRSASRWTDVADAAHFNREITPISGPLLGQSPLRSPGFAGAIAAALRIKSPPSFSAGGAR